MSLIGQWSQEFSKYLHPGTLRVVMYYGPERDRLDLFSKEQSWDVVITTYGILISEWKKYLSSSSSSSWSSLKSSSGLRSPVDSLYRHRWARVLLDEAHCIRNQKTDAFKACAALVSDCRWVITGTPIQNKIDDLFSLVKFLQHEPWNQWRWWYKTIMQQQHTQHEASDQEHGSRQVRVPILKELLQTIMLRRTKNSVDLVTGMKILNLPPKVIEIKFVELNFNEKIFYETFARRSQELSEKILRTYSSEGGRGRAGTSGSSVIKGYAALFTLLMRLRQICNHPLLVLKSLTAATTSSSSSSSSSGRADLDLNTIHLRQPQEVLRRNQTSEAEGGGAGEGREEKELQQQGELEQQSSEYLKTIMKKFEKYLQPDLGRNLEGSQPEEESSLESLQQQENVFDQECVVCLELLEVCEPFLLHIDSCW
jgi:SNF2 family DNA or RNA helicase